MPLDPERDVLYSSHLRRDKILCPVCFKTGLRRHVESLIRTKPSLLSMCDVVRRILLRPGLYGARMVPFLFGRNVVPILVASLAYGQRGCGLLSSRLTALGSSVSITVITLASSFLAPRILITV
jgi:hypothetical protein